MNRRSVGSTKLFVGGLTAEANADDLRRLFDTYGVISECDIVNRCGFLYLEDRVLALKAIDELNNSQFMGNRISVELGRTKLRPSGPPSQDGGGRMRSNMDYMGRNNGPYSRNIGGRGGYGDGGHSRMGGYERDYYSDRNSVLTPIRNNDRTYSSYGSHRGGMGNPSPIYSRSYGVADNTSAPSHQPPASSNVYSMGGGGYDDTRRTYDDRLRSSMGGGGAYDERGAVVMSGGGILGERRPTAMTQGMTQYNRTDNYAVDNNRSDSSHTKQYGGYTDRGYSASTGYATYSSAPGNQNGSYGSYASQLPSMGAYNDNRQTPSSGYGSSGGGYASSMTGYGTTGGSYGTSSGGYGNTGASYGSYGPSTAYGTSSSGAGGIGNSYDQRTYENAYAQPRSGYAAAYDAPSNYNY